ncbi:DUF4153 domain-containing protein [Chryseobacterium indologenes]|uniref:DUF4153 domain-containing protein n=1 Tax=Chryseobacterium indologenes TaxID=253 RepID=UPI000F501420|nr:DUF4153 domain-containing protein [Chryseobacterium indologenes]AYZ35978.1 DUF4153 domain-containing protein [Chryseobacterium indologenes]MBF6644763.1 DUF4153 domain-containing protein [Chryseobacterium indologenes]MBU3050458.1 DUF4153 domain-containing protein [Chryseobacterium indologenes]MEB4759757.1 DUF4153 domain-containing protein [Chryseobacterium indologenes]QQQ71545.1 DUF4153 domain-containing protein [Chryseobacterium indologenes]
MKTKFRETLNRTTEIIFRYPVVLVMAILASTGAICMIDTSNQFELYASCLKFTICACLGISLMFAMTMLSQRIGKELLLQLAGIAFLIGFYNILPNKKSYFTDDYSYLIVVTGILMHLLVSFIPFLEKNKELGFWQYNKNLFVNIFLTAVFTGVLTGGVELAILAIDKLFDFHFNDKLYVNTFFVMAITGSCFIFLLFNEKGLPTLEKDASYPVVLKFFTQFILIPLLLIYAVILYFYSFKILIHWQLPRGWVSYLILAYSMVGILALLLVHPLKEANAKSWVKIFSKAFYYTIIPLVALLFIAIFTRILEYGYTEPRYFVLLLALWLLSVVIYFISNKKATIKFIPVSLFLFGAFAMIFPYINAFSVARRSQRTELLKVLTQQKLLDNGKINFEQKITDTIRNEIADKFQFLAERKQSEFILGLLDKKDRADLTKSIEAGNFYSIRFTVEGKFTHVNTTTRKDSYDTERLVIVSEQQAIKIDDYQYLLNVTGYNQDPQKLNEDQFKIIDKLTERSSFKLILNNKEEIEAGPEIMKLFQENKGKTGTVYVPDIKVEDDLGKYHIKLILKQVTKEKDFYNKRNNIYCGDVYILIKPK